MIEEKSRVPNPARYVVVSRHGNISPIQFETVQEAAEYARTCFPNQEQDPDRTGNGWDVEAVS